MRKVVLFLIALFLALVFSPGLQASNIRMMSLANPWLTIPDPDTDWIYNPAYILYAPNQAFGEYIFGYGRRESKEEFLTFAGNSEENRRSHTGEIGLIHNLGKGKFGITGAYSHFRFENEFNHFSDQDIDLAAAYAIPLSSEFSGGLSVSYKSWDEGTEKFDFHRWDVSLGSSWQPIPNFKIGLSGGGGGYYGDNNRKGSHAHLLANSDYIVCDRLTIPIIIQGRWEEKKQDIDGRRFFSKAKIREPWWDILFKTGVHYVIDKNSKFLLGGEIYYSYANWKHEVNTQSGFLFVGGNSLTDKRKTHNVGTRIGLEGKIYEGLMARMGLYYNYSFFDGGSSRSSIPIGVLAANSEEDGWSQTLGIGLGLGYTPIRRLRFDLGFDIPFINKEHSKVDFIPLPGTEKMEVKDLLYRIGFNLTYFF